MPNVLLIAGTTGYQTRAFEGAAERLGVDLVYATDRCHALDDPWRDGAIPVAFHDLDASLRAIVAGIGERAVGGVIALGDRQAVLGAYAAEALGLKGHPPHAARAAGSKLLSRGRFMAAGLAVPWFVSMPLDETIGRVADRLRFPCVVKPLALSGSRGVIRADTPDQLDAAVGRLRAILRSPDVIARRDPADTEILIEGFVPGAELALEGVLDEGRLRVLAIFDKPDPLDGPFFEETIYVTPPAIAPAEQRVIAGTVAHAAAALGLRHGPVHAEVRVNDSGVFVLEVAARPIGGLCGRALRFTSAGGAPIAFEDVILRHASGQSLDGVGREAAASAVMMMPVPGRGYLREVTGCDEARQVPGVEDVIVTAKPGQLLVPLPEGHSYPGFVFARAATAREAVGAVREAHRRLAFRLDASLLTG
jgi:biotin carboxylase